MISFLPIMVLGLAAGVSIGAIGIGGIVIVPILVQSGVPIREAIALAMAGYILTGLTGTWAYVRHGTLDWRDARRLCLGAMPGAIAGAFAVRLVSPFVLDTIIAVTATASGLHVLFGRRQIHGRKAGLSRIEGMSTGLLVGFVSALTGTGGPAILVPVLLWMNIPILVSLGLAQAIQVPIATLATASNIMAGGVDFRLGLVLGLTLSLGAWLGAQVAHRLDRERLRLVTAIVFTAVGLFMTIKAVEAAM